MRRKASRAIKARKLGAIRRVTERAILARLTGQIDKAMRIERKLDLRVERADRMGLDTLGAEERAHNRAYRRYRNL